MELHEERNNLPGWDTKCRCTCGYESVSRAEQWKHSSDALRSDLAAMRADRNEKVNYLLRQVDSLTVAWDTSDVARQSWMDRALAAEQESAAMRAVVEGLREALTKYGSHKDFCNWYCSERCNCGLSAALDSPRSLREATCPTCGAPKDRPGPLSSPSREPEACGHGCHLDWTGQWVDSLCPIHAPADPPRDRQECAFCKGAGNLAVARVVGRKVFHDERPCPKCGGSGLAPADPPREPRECCCGHDEVTHPGGGWCGEDCYCSSFRPITPREPEA